MKTTTMIGLLASAATALGQTTEFWNAEQLEYQKALEIQANRNKITSEVLDDEKARQLEFQIQQDKLTLQILELDIQKLQELERQLELEWRQLKNGK
jgi:hypothetical protein